MAVLVIVKIEEKTYSTTELFGPDPDWEGEGDPPIVKVRSARTWTDIEPVIDIPFSWQGIQLRPAAQAMLVLIDSHSRMALGVFAIGGLIGFGFAAAAFRKIQGYLAAQA